MSLSPKQTAKVQELAYGVHAERMRVVGMLRVREGRITYRNLLQGRLRRLQETLWAADPRQVAAHKEAADLVADMQAQIAEVVAEITRLHDQVSDVNDIYAAPMEQVITSVLEKARVQRSDLGIVFVENVVPENFLQTQSPTPGGPRPAA